MTILLWYIEYESLTFFLFSPFFDLSPHFTIYCWILRSGFDKNFSFFVFFFSFFFFFFFLKNCSYVSLLVLCNRSEQLLLNTELKMPSDVFFFIVTRSWNMFWNGKSMFQSKIAVERYRQSWIFCLPGKNGIKTELLAQIPGFHGIMIEALPL